ncbi:MAG: non-heme iron oxygenase ferredoxin subunit [Frankiales bacterium]|jgi:nitrite reductase/ring-hydroxylating ferredoxin subunit|nr:non-heme iron oxygenase ferredoxin subunit [Frankiales bacterium]
MNRLLCETADVPDGGKLALQPEGSPELVVFNISGTFYVLADTCSHGAAALSEGDLIGCEIECPLHQGRFDVTTGAATRRPAKKPQPMYRCQVEDGRLYLIDADESADAKTA